MSQDPLNAVAMLCMEKKLITVIHNFNHKVTEKCVSFKKKSATFMYKK